LPLPLKVKVLVKVGPEVGSPVGAEVGPEVGSPMGAEVGPEVGSGDGQKLRSLGVP
jgi:hypothetical protein